MSEDFLIRSLLSQDFARGFFETLSALSPSPQIGPDKVDDIFFDREEVGNFTFVAVERATDAVVGTASIVMENKFTRGGFVVVHIEDVSVHEDYQSMGIGTQLIQHIVDATTALGGKRVILDCDEAVASFYERFGFVKQGVAMRLEIA